VLILSNKIELGGGDMREKRNAYKIFKKPYKER
jgi:hypothetical protein